MTVPVDEVEVSTIGAASVTVMVVVADPGLSRKLSA
jgi:hypothetical protein